MKKVEAKISELFDLEKTIAKSLFEIRISLGSFTTYRNFY